jgi:phosphoribosylglycinamide formyltransferase-1
LKKAKQAGLNTFVIDYAQIYTSVKENPKEFETIDLSSKIAPLQEKKIPLEDKIHSLARLAAEKKLLSIISPLQLDLLVLAGFMRRLTPFFVDLFSPPESQLPRIMNIHPSLLPAFPGADGYGDCVRFGCKIAGCTVHFVDHGLDTGPIIAQEAFAIEETDTIQSVREKGLRIEWKLYPRCINWYAKGKIQLEIIHNKKRVKII